MNIPGNDLKARVEYFSDWDYQLKVAGVSFSQKELGELYDSNWNELEVYLKPEPDNKFDANAIAILAIKDGVMAYSLGYVPAAVAEHLIIKLNHGIEYTCALVYITSGNHGKIRTAKIALREK